MGTAAASPSITFTPLAGGAAGSYDLGAIEPGSLRLFDPRYANGDTTQAFCGTATDRRVGSNRQDEIQREYVFATASKGFNR